MRWLRSTASPSAPATRARASPRSTRSTSRARAPSWRTPPDPQRSIDTPKETKKHVNHSRAAGGHRADCQEARPPGEHIADAGSPAGDAHVTYPAADCHSVARTGPARADPRSGAEEG